MSVYLAEFLGTFLLIVFGGGVVAGAVLKTSKAFDTGWLTIVIAWGLGVTFAIYAVGNISGAHINPAVTLGLAFAGEFQWNQVAGYMAAQLLGAFSGAVLVWIFYIPHWVETDDKTAKLAVFSTVPAIRSYIHNFVSEMIGTAVLLFGLLFIGANNFTEGLNPLVVGALIMAIGFSLGGTTGFAINPARDLGPRIAHYFLPIRGKGISDWNYAAIPVFGPILGALLGASLYQILYENDMQFKYGFIITLSISVLIFAVLKANKPNKSE
ncbi:MAG: aquaporin family protein [Flavobacteriaceae bacterium]|nr:aquaporin family protein [Flavobacteriaceae bacterium]